jgi:histone H3/H4
VQASESLSKTFPEQIDIIVEKALSTAGLSRSDVTPQAMACLLEHARRYASDLIKDAQDYAHSASRLEITKQDLSLVMEFQDESNSISSQIPKLNLLSQQINRVPLPPIPPQCYSGVLLPPKEHQLTARTFDVVSGARISRRMTQILPINPRTPPKASSNDKPNQSYGAMKGPQIPITLKTNTGVAPMETEATVPSTGHEGGESQSTAAVNAPADSLHPALL